MSTTVSMWLGIAFVGLAIGASIIQAWLWSFPMVPDPGGPDPNGKSTAPRVWTNLHRGMGFAYLIIYVVLMVEMIPRLWNYQFELPARTIMHATMGIMIGVLLIAKISVIRWFQHFGKSLPALGLGLLVCTMVLGTLSLPFALRAHDFGSATTPKNLERVRRVLKSVPFEEKGIDTDSLATEAAFKKGLGVLTTKCVSCHDMREIMSRPRTGKDWYKVVKRMVKKPMVGEPIHGHEIPPVTAYLIAITPDLQRAFEMTKDRKKEKKAMVAGLQKAQPVTELVAAPAVDEGKVEALLTEKCTECHDPVSEKFTEHGKDDRAGWVGVVSEMMDDQGADIDTNQALMIIDYLVAKHGKPVEAGPEPPKGANDFGDALTPSNLERAAKVFGTITWEESGVEPAKLASEASFRQGRDVLTKKCVVCHDMREIFRRPRTGEDWYKVVKRMAKMPTIGEGIGAADIPPVVAYLVAINSVLQRSYQADKVRDRERKSAVANVRAAQSSDAPAAVDLGKAEALYSEKCAECHDLEQISGYGGADRAGWTKIVTNMIEEQEATITEDEAKQIIYFLTVKYGK